jgi:AraC-like DNA-binding protein
MELTGETVTDASLAVGYANPSHFARLFRRHYGVSPRLLR